MEAEERLLAFERMYRELSSQHARDEAELAALRAAGKEKTVRFSELLGEKLLLARQLALYEKYGL